MRTWLSLDMSIKSTGWALWSEGQERPAYGTWALAPDLSWAGRAFVRLHKNILDLHRLTPINALVFEAPLQAGQLHGHTNVETLEALIGLAAHAKSFAEAVGARHRAVHQATWRRHFIGRMPRGTKSPDLKAMAMARCRELGFDPAKHDAAEALGLLDYELSVSGILPPWRAGSPLQRELMPATDGRAAAREGRA